MCTTRCRHLHRFFYCQLINQKNEIIFVIIRRCNKVKAAPLFRLLFGSVKFWRWWRHWRHIVSYLFDSSLILLISITICCTSLILIYFAIYWARLVNRYLKSLFIILMLLLAPFMDGGQQIVGPNCEMGVAAIDGRFFYLLSRRWPTLSLAAPVKCYKGGSLYALYKERHTNRALPL